MSDSDDLYATTAQVSAGTADGGGLWPAVVAAALGLVALAFFSVTAGDERTGQYVVLAPMATKTGVIGLIHQAGGNVINTSMVPGVAVAWSDDPGFQAAARGRGAWMVLPTNGFAGCTIISEGKTA
ncbi:hypothetical protein [uncultured Paracoccus sp.]|uniref:hypothetical protein n=1 Tax=uncultured Paracoccus sp. TaxID=189685 RepID=UPI0025FDADE2|nr:hypothetical protein [uncultured Paracoccus sp.]